MLSRSARIAAILIMSQAFFAPKAQAAARFNCSDPGPHICCNADSSCSSGVYCCFYPNNSGTVPGQGCGCQAVS